MKVGFAMMKNKIIKNVKLTKKHKELITNSTISEEFMNLIDSVRFDDNFCANIFNIIKKYVSYDIAGLFFNDSSELEINVLNISVPKKNITLPVVEEIRESFFDEVEQYKRVYDIQCNIIDSDIASSGQIKCSSFKTPFIATYNYGENFIGGFFIASVEKYSPEEKLYLDIIFKELEVIFKLKYLIHEQQKHALLDPMTKLYNRQEFDHAFEFEFIKARRYIINFTLAILDIDYLSKINEKYGKAYGDYVITELADLLKKTFRRTDPIYRYGAEEFIIMLPFTPITKSLIPIERFRNSVASHKFEKDGVEANVTVSVGLCANYSKFTEPEQMIEGLGTALVRAKERGRNKVDIFE